MWGPRGLPLGKIGTGASLSAFVEGVHLQKEAVIIRAPLILVMSVPGIHID
jgi:hypothetical protein